MVDKIMHAFQSGAVAQGIQNPQALSEAEKAALAGIADIDPRKGGPASIEEELKTILTPEQYGAHTQARDARWIANAEDTASDTLQFIGRSFDLSPEQKDKIFQALAHHELTNAAPATAVSDDPFPTIGSKQEGRDRIIREHLTPDQAAIFDKYRAAERETLKRQMMEFYSKQSQ